MASEEGRVNFLATGDSVLPAGAAQPMALGGGDVMRLPRLLLGTGQRILLEAQAAELPRLGGGREREGEGKAGRASQSCCCLLPLSTPPAPPNRGALGTTPHSDMQDRTVWVHKGRLGLPTQLEKTDIQPTIGTQGTGELG